MTRLTAVLLLVTTAASAQVNPGGPRAAAMAGAGAALSGDAHSSANPAAWADVSSGGLTLTAAQLFGLAELRFAEAFVVVPLLGGGGAVGGSTFGFDEYRETILSFGYARAVHPGTARPLHAGVRIQWLAVTVSGYGSAHIPSISAGLIVPLTPVVALGLAASNIYVPPMELAADVERSLRIGVAFTPARDLLVAFDAWKATTSQVDFRAGLELRPVDAVALRAGVTPDPVRLTAGAGFRVSSFHFDLAVERHETLGWSPVIGARIQW